MFKGHCEHLQILNNGGLTDILYMPYLYKSIVLSMVAKYFFGLTEV